MITGVVDDNAGRVRITVRGIGRKQRNVEAIIDTGFTASLTLPPAFIDKLGLRWPSMDRATLADGSECLLDVFEANVLWDGKLQRILIQQADAVPLVGMGLLNGYELKMQIRAGGKVTIKQLPSR
jgi:clan AA aspartic protease